MRVSAYVIFGWFGRLPCFNDGEVEDASRE